VVKIIYCKQEQNWSCGPAVVRMVLSSFGIRKSEEELIEILGSNNKIGTANKNMVEFFKGNGFSLIEKENSKIADLKRFYDDGFRIIVNYYCHYEKEGHFAVVKLIDNKRIYLYDPALGEKHSYSLKYFNKIWYGKGGERKWFLAVGEPIENELYIWPRPE